MHEVVQVVVEQDSSIEPRWLGLRRLTLRNRRADGTLSAPYFVDYVTRPKGLDAIAVALFARAESRSGWQVLLRDGMRPPLYFGRHDDPTLAVPEPERLLFLREIVAGIVEAGDAGEDGLRRRAAAEVHEEAGYEVAPDAIVMLGSIVPAPGVIPEKLFLSAVEIADPAAQAPLHGDGSPMEEGARTYWVDLDDSIAMCAAGDIIDAKTEIALRRLRDYLDARR